MCEKRRSALPAIVATVDVRDRKARQLFLGELFQASDVNAVHLADGGLVADTERAHAAMLAEVVVVLPGVKHVAGQIRFACQQAKPLGLHHRRPEARSPADGAVAPVCGLREVDVSLELHRAAMATAMVSVQHEAQGTATFTRLDPTGN